MTEAAHRSRGALTGLSRVLKNVLMNWAGYLASILIGFLVSPFVVHHLGNELYGVWSLIVSLTGYLGLLDLGVRGAVTRYVARFHTQGSDIDSSKLISSALAVFAGAGLLAIAISAGLAFLAMDRLLIPRELLSAARIVVCLAGVTVASSLVGGVFGGVVAGLQRFELTNLAETGVSVGRAISIVLALHWGKGIVTLGILQLLFSVAAGSVNLCISFKLYPKLHVGVSRLSSEHLRMIFSYGVYSFLLQAFVYLILYTDAVVIAAFLPITMVTFFAIAENLISYSKRLVGGMTTPMTPLASQLQARGGHEELRQVIIDWSRYATSLGLAIGITFLIRGSTFIGLWMGPAYTSLSGRVLQVLTIGLIPAASFSVPWAVTFGIGRHRALVPVYFIVAVTNLGLSIALIKPLGIVGVAWGTAVPELLVSVFFWPWYLQKVLRVPAWQFITQVWGRALLAMFPFALCTYGMERTWSASNVYVFFGQVGLAVLVGLFAFWLACVSRGDRQSYMGSLKTFLDLG